MSNSSGVEFNLFRSEWNRNRVALFPQVLLYFLPLDAPRERISVQQFFAMLFRTEKHVTLWCLGGIKGICGKRAVFIGMEIVSDLQLQGNWRDAITSVIYSLK